MLKTYFSYIQNVLGSKSFMLPEDLKIAVEPATFHFAAPSLSLEAREVLENIAKALKLKKYDIIELKIDGLEIHPVQEPMVGAKIESQKQKSNQTLIIFGEKAVQFLLPHTTLEIGKPLMIEGSQTLWTHSVDEMLKRPELKRETWQHLKSFTQA